MKVGDSMQQIGIVREVFDEYTLVEVSRKSACENCHANIDGGCSACVSFGSKAAVSKAENSIGANIGDRVIIETVSSTVLLYAAAVFLFPLVLGFCGYFIGGLFEFEAAPYFFTLAGFAIAFLIVFATLNHSAKKRLDVKIVRILQKGGDESC